MIGISSVHAAECVEQADEVLRLFIKAVDDLVRLKLKEGFKDEIGPDMPCGLLSFAAFVPVGDINGDVVEIACFVTLLNPVLESAFVPLIQVVMVKARVTIGGEPVSDLSIGFTFIE